MLINRKQDMTPFDMAERPCRQSALLLPLVWGVSYFATHKNRLRIEKVNMEGLKPPYLVLSTHQGFSDYYIAPLALFPHRANYVSDMEGFAAFGKTLYRRVGCIGKRRFVPDVSVIRNIEYVLKKSRDILVLFPESRHSNAGTHSPIPGNMGRLAKRMGVPCVTLSVHGSYLAGPFWDEERSRKTPMTARLERIYSAEELAAASAEEIQKTVEKRLRYDEYAWQAENRIAIREPYRAEGLHKALYQCRACEREGCMTSAGDTLRCCACGSRWTMDEYGRLGRKGESLHIPDWYAWQRDMVSRQIEAGAYALDLNVRVEALPNEKGFVQMGTGRLTHTAEGFRLTLPGKTLFFSTRSMESVQTEYNYRGRGMAVVLSHRNCCYYVYGEAPDFQPTKLQFAAEYFHTKGYQA